MKKVIIIIVVIILALPFIINYPPYAGYGYDSDASNNLPELVNNECEKMPRNELKNYFYVYCDTLGNQKRISWDSVHAVIEEYVLEITGNDTIVLVDQKPFDKFYEDYYGPDNPNAIRDSLYASPFHEYWIITKRDSHIYGPMSKSQYYIWRTKLGVPDDIRLSFEKGKFAERLLDIKRVAYQKMWDIVFDTVFVLFIIAVIKIFKGIKILVNRSKQES